MLLENEHMKSWIEDGIQFIVYNKGVVFDLAVAHQCLTDRIKLGDRVPYELPLVADFRGMAYATSEARKYLAADNALIGLTAGSFVISSQTTRFIFNAFFSINQPRRPARVFNSMKKATAWASRYRSPAYLAILDQTKNDR